jgi:hypothetical protein
VTDAEFQFYVCGCSAYVTYERNADGNVLNHTVLASPGPCENPSVHP